jgi:hypothetical protein
MHPILNCWKSFQAAHGCSVDRMVCEPTIRCDFLQKVRAETTFSDEGEILWLVMNARKAKRFTSGNVNALIQ